MVDRSGTLEDVYVYAGSLASLNDTLLVSAFLGPTSGTLDFDDTDNDQNFEAGETGTWNGAAATYVGGGTATVGVTLGIGPLATTVNLSGSEPVQVFATGSHSYFHYPEGDPAALLDGLATQILDDPLLDGLLTTLGLNDYDLLIAYLEEEALLTFDLSASGELFVCFCAGTMIDTPWGEVPIETLQPGDLVLDRAGRRREILWHGRRRMSLKRLPRADRARLLPVVIPADAFGPGLPRRALRLSQQHRVMVQGNRLETLFGLERALTPARALLGHRVRLDWRAQRVTYHHLLCEEHTVIRSDGLETETLLPRDGAMEAMSEAQRDELMMLFPELEACGESQVTQPALPLLKRREGVMFAV